MKKIKHILAAALVATMMMTTGVVSNAATVEVKTSTNYVKDRSFKAYQVFDADWEGENLTNISAGEGINWSKELWDKIQKIEGFESVDDTTKLLAALNGKSTAVGEKIAKVLKDYTVAGKAITVKNGDTIADGYYIILDETDLSNNDVANAALLQVAGDKVVINVKTDKPTIEKKIDGAKDADSGTTELVDYNNGQVNDLVPYVITSTVPDTTYYDKYYMEFNDTVSSGLDISAIDATTDKFSDYKVFVDDTEMNSTAYTLTVDTTNRKISVKFKDVKGLDGKVLKLTYNAKINSNAVVGKTGNPNEVTLKYTNSPDHSGEGEYDNTNYISETPKDVVITYLTGIKILKVDANDTNKTLEGAEFSLKGSREVSSLVSGIRYVEDSNGTYYKLATGAYTTTAPTTETSGRYDAKANGKKFKKESYTEVKTETNNVEISGISDGSGNITFNELGAGDYTITEVLAPNGYNKLKDPIKFTISFTAPTNAATDGTEECSWDKNVISGIDNKSIVFDEDGMFKITVANNTGATLPSTGGIGTTILYVVGGILVIGGAAAIFIKRKKDAE